MRVGLKNVHVVLTMKNYEETVEYLKTLDTPFTLFVDPNDDNQDNRLKCDWKDLPKMVSFFEFLSKSEFVDELIWKVFLLQETSLLLSDTLSRNAFIKAIYFNNAFCKNMLNKMKWIKNYESPRIVFKSLQNKENITKICITNKFKHDDEVTLQALSGLFSNNIHLKEVNMSRCGLVMKQSVLVLFSLRSNMSLTHLDWSYNELGDGGFLVAAQILNDLRHLKKLNLEKCGLGPKFIDSFIDALKYNTSLTYINLTHNNFFGSETKFYKVLQCNTKLTTMFLGTLDKDKYADDFKSAFLNNRTLTAFNTISFLSHFKYVEHLQRNKEIHSLVRKGCELLLSIKKFRSSLLNVLGDKEITKMIAKNLLETKSIFLI